MRVLFAVQTPKIENSIKTNPPFRVHLGPNEHLVSSFIARTCFF